MKRFIILFIFTVSILLSEEQAKAAGLFAKSNPQMKSVLTDRAFENIFKKEEVIVWKCTGEEIAEYACQFIGNPYTWGGTSLVDGADCSGFVQAVYGHFGIEIPRTSYEQRSIGEEVSYENVEIGDIICYQGHVGIYIGDGKIVNARSPEEGIGVTVAEYAEILTVRRVVKIEDVLTNV